MGACASAPDTEETKRDRMLQKELAMANKQQEAIHKLLLLGAGQSGKSTLFKQMTTIYGEGFNEATRRDYRPIIFGNVISAMQVLVGQAEMRSRERKLEAFRVASSLRREADNVQRAQPNTDELEPELAQSIAALWKDPAIQATFEVRSEFQLNDSAPYYFDRVLDLARESYVPTEDDVLRSRARTTGVIENKFTIESTRFEMFDVGGQRSERKKWFHCFDKVSAVLYVVAISAYDQVLFEDGETNRMVEALELFDEICNSRWFAKTSLILFLNKRDLFELKIRKVPITVSPALAAFEGDTTDFGATTDFIIEVFEDRNKTERDIYPHVTCATDKGNVHKVFDGVKDTVMKKGLAAAGFGI